jgi:hypothetical protein
MAVSSNWQPCHAPRPIRSFVLQDMVHICRAILEYREMTEAPHINNNRISSYREITKLPFFLLALSISRELFRESKSGNGTSHPPGQQLAYPHVPNTLSIYNSGTEAWNTPLASIISTSSFRRLDDLNDFLLHSDLSFAFFFAFIHLFSEHYHHSPPRVEIEIFKPTIGIAQSTTTPGFRPTEASTCHIFALFFM